MNYKSFISAVEDLTLMYQQKNPDMYVSVTRTDYGLELVCMSKEQARKQWVEQMLTEYSNDYDWNSEIVLCDKEHKVLVASFEYNLYRNDHGYGIARCSSDDKFDKDVGLAVAFAHFRKYPIPDFV